MSEIQVLSSTFKKRGNPVLLYTRADKYLTKKKVISTSLPKTKKTHQFLVFPLLWEALIHILNNDLYFWGFKEML